MNPTKYNILTAEVAAMEAEVAKRKSYLEGLDKTRCGLNCSGCNFFMGTEADFANHFVVAQMDRINGHLNLGECPASPKGRNITENFNASRR